MSHSTEIEQTILELRDRWAEEFDADPKTINRGSCAIFGIEVTEECPFAELRKTGNEKVTALVSLDDVDDPVHVWVSDGEYHYDAETPTGVKDWTDLPFFQRTLEE